jgi:hypothetical protein
MNDIRRFMLEDPTVEEFGKNCRNRIKNIKIRGNKAALGSEARCRAIHDIVDLRQAMRNISEEKAKYKECVRKLLIEGDGVLGELVKDEIITEAHIPMSYGNDFVYSLNLKDCRDHGCKRIEIDMGSAEFADYCENNGDIELLVNNVDRFTTKSGVNQYNLRIADHYIEHATDERLAEALETGLFVGDEVIRYMLKKAVEGPFYKIPALLAYLSC